MPNFTVQPTDYAHGLFSADIKPQTGNSVKAAFKSAFAGSATDPTLQPEYIVPIVPGGGKGWEALWAAAESYVTANKCTEQTPLTIRAHVKGGQGTSASTTVCDIATVWQPSPP